MNVNATIFAQALNFFITYWMLRQFLFRPAVAIIEHENAQEHALLDIITQQQKSLEIQEKERQRHWYICQEYFNIHRPSLHPQTFSSSDETEQVIIDFSISPHVLAETIGTVGKRLEEKLKHVH
jgi:hypothetical protein